MTICLDCGRALPSGGPYCETCAEFRRGDFWALLMVVGVAVVVVAIMAGKGCL